jgi:hypothetical protein
MASGISLEQDEVVWCAACGIPHDAGATHCSFCSRPLKENTASGDGISDEADDALDAQTGALARAIADRAAAQRPSRPRRAAPWALPRRVAPLTDDEIDARAAAIVAQARQEEDEGATEALFPAGAGSMSDAEQVSQLDFLPPLRQRDREWLLAGLFCCIILIVGAIVIVRFFAV